jgi:hypothetical protein
MEAQRWTRVRRAFAYGGALALTPYLVIKVCWVTGAVLGLLPRGGQLSVAGFIVLNVATIGMSAIGIGLALALARPWGVRIPAFFVLAFAFFGCGWLVTAIPYIVAGALVPRPGSAPTTESIAMPAWEGLMIQLSFLGLGVGLAVALPLYLVERWPGALTGTPGPVRPVRAGAAWPAMVGVVGAVLAGAIDVYWAAGGTLGLSHPDARDTDWHLLAADSGLWALAGAWAVGVLRWGGPARLPRWVPISLSWLASGMLAAWGLWKLPFTLYLQIGSNVTTAWPENLAVAAARSLTGVLAGTAMLIVTMTACRASNAASPDRPVAVAVEQS